MNTHFTRKTIAIISNLITVGALAFGGLFLAPSAAYAQDATPTPRFTGERLEFLCRQVGRMLEGQQDRLNLANSLASHAETWIADLKAKGKDVAALETALAAYRSGLAAAQAKHDEAQSAYKAQAGFSGNCKLTDREQAKEMLKSVGDAMREAHRALKDAGRAFHRAVQEWRKANRSTRATTAAGG